MKLLPAYAEKIPLLNADGSDENLLLGFLLYIIDTLRSRIRSSQGASGLGRIGLRLRVSLDHVVKTFSQTTGMVRLAELRRIARPTDCCPEALVDRLLRICLG